MTPSMTRDEALAEAKKLYGERGDTVKLGVSHFIGYQISKDRWNWIGHGRDWQSAIADAKAQEPERKEKSAELKERLGRVTVRFEGNEIRRTWHGVEHVVHVVGDGRFEYLGIEYASATAAAKAITGAASINGRAFFNLDAKGGAA